MLLRLEEMNQQTQPPPSLKRKTTAKGKPSTQIDWYGAIVLGECCAHISMIGIYRSSLRSIAPSHQPLPFLRLSIAKRERKAEAIVCHPQRAVGEIM